MKVRAFELAADLLLDAPEKAFDLRRIRVAHGIGEGNRVAEFGERNRDSHHVIVRHFTLHRAAEGSRDGAFDLGTTEGGALAHFCDHLLRRHAHVRFAVRAARGDRERDLVRACVHGALKAFDIRRERDHLQTADGERMLDDVAGVSHCWDELRRDEGADFDFAQSCGGEGADPRLLRLGRHEVLGVLQAVARAHLADMNVRHDQAAVTGSLSSTILRDHSAGPVSCTELPFASTATVTGMFSTSNS
jgi:hypothetical protein